MVQRMYRVYPKVFLKLNNTTYMLGFYKSKGENKFEKERGAEGG